MKILLSILSLLLFVGCEQKPMTPEETAFKEASGQILSETKGYAYGESKEAKELAKNFSLMLKKLQKEFFTGGKKNRKFSLTKDNFLTYCKINEKSVVFLVHVPQFKKYKGKVRDSLNELVWLVGNEVTKEFKTDVPNLEIVIALKGSVAYGASAVGIRGQEAKMENSFIIDDDQFHKYFKK